MLTTLIASRNNLRNNLNKHKFALLGLQDQYAPILNKIDEVKDTLQSIELHNGKDAGKTLSIEAPLPDEQLSTEERRLWSDIKDIGTKRKENGTLRLSEVNGDSRLYQIGNRTLALNHNLVLTSTDGSNLKLNKGLTELFFQTNPDPQVYTKDDVNVYKQFINSLGIQINENTKKQKEIKINVGRGFKNELANGALSQPKAIILPDDVIKLRQRLQVLLAAKQEGHNNVFNEANEILKILLDKKQITNEGYKQILSLLKEQ